MENDKLLTRDVFRGAVFLRDKNKCVFCDLPAKDAHHILERRLWPDGGYYLSNGASVCGMHHMLCETTEISVEEVREAAGITKPALPPHFYSDVIYDKWGNIVLTNGTRLKGELFYDESVQKVLAQGNVLHLFTNLVKYPRTFHLPWSENMNEDDRMLSGLETFEAFKGKRVIVTEKMDGENTTLYNNYIHARSIDGRNHPSRSWVKQFWSMIAGDIPEGWRVCGENLYAKHSIFYSDLPSYFMGFSIWNEKNVCLSWENTVDWFNLLGIESVPVLFDGLYDEKIIKGMWDKRNWEKSEGYVVRLADPIPYGDFRKKFAKFVRKNHVNTVRHWMHGQKLECNLLKPC